MCVESASSASTSFRPSVSWRKDKATCPSFERALSSIQLDVTVLDDKRQPVRGLTAADFTVLDSGVATPIRAFTPVELAVRTRSTEAVWAAEVPPDVATNQAGEQDGRLVIILMDRTIPLQQPTVVARRIAAAAVEALGPRDLAAVVSTKNGAVQNSTIQNLTADRTRLLRAINAGDPSTGISAGSPGDPDHGQAESAQRRAMPMRGVRARDDCPRGRRRAERGAAAQNALLHWEQRDLAIGRRSRRTSGAIPCSRTRARSCSRRSTARI